MPYDPRKISEGGNRGMGDKFKKNAPAGQFRVVMVDTFDGSDYYKDIDDLESAISFADEKGGSMQKAYVYDENGKYVHEAGTF